jgi:hypothetical protein
MTRKKQGRDVTRESREARLDEGISTELREACRRMFLV